MKTKRHILFNSNRESLSVIMENANQDEIIALQQAITQMQFNHQKQIEELQQQLLNQQQQHEQKLQQQQQQLILSPEQTINHFRHLKAFNGNDEYTLQEFIRSVDNAIQLCGNNNQLLIYVTQIVLNEKIQGNAKRCIQRLGSNTSWQAAKQELRLHFRPREDYAELINKTRNIKVDTLRELFDQVRQTNYLLNELYELDEGKEITYTPENNDRYLVGIVLEKLDNLVRGFISPNSTLITMYNKFAELKLLDDERAISKNCRRNNNNRHDNTFKNKPRYSNNYSGNKDQNRNSPQNKLNNRYNFSQVQNNEYTRNNYSGQFRNNNTPQFNTQNTRQFNNTQQINLRNNSGQYRNQTHYQNRNNLFSRQNNSNPEPMEVENIQQDVNFTKEPRVANSQL